MERVVHGAPFGLRCRTTGWDRVAAAWRAVSAGADRAVEIRACDDCGPQIETEPYFTTPPGNSTTNLFE
ncbi:hypothetical protein [Streptomyces yanii]|uniref:Uncharacterized protein n=1 Tax=Streptomyces yanii TaxID=78510 RepID=A0ABV5RNN2_9ACTN